MNMENNREHSSSLEINSNGTISPQPLLRRSLYPRQSREFLTMSTNPFAGVGLMADMVKFIDFVSTTIKESKEISQSPQGATQANEDIETICTSLRDLSLNLVGAPSSQQAIVSAVLSPSDVRIKDMAQGCVDIANKILDTVHPLARGKSSRKAFSTLYYALKCAWKRGEVKALEDRLEKLREQLNLEIVALARQVNFLYVVSGFQIPDSLAFTAIGNVSSNRLFRRSKNKVWIWK